MFLYMGVSRELKVEVKVVSTEVGGDARRKGPRRYLAVGQYEVNVDSPVPV